MFYGIHQANRLRQEWERHNNIKYDLIFRLRPDLIYNGPIELNNKLEDINNGVLFLNSIYLSGWESSIDEEGMSYGDMFAFGNRDKMSQFCSLYPNTDELLKEYPCERPERTLFNWTSLKNNIQCKEYKDFCSILR